ncbi:PEP-CTERM sorting domain-containing protein [Adhaeretor mobilis]|uniref:PEP-CTERM motif protein n=1 Tax=Adhaeretor mobilis TaxID=1930276 RepID=A0A517N101_9BACT|nr:PEP-CTERM sorting domain-containing protein [Adhaeretor mobilis]QDT00811.1 PEP-CTERM motif protein [Adhaeretor mobilis]
MRSFGICSVFLAVIALCQLPLASAGIIEDFQFSDVSGTEIENAANDAGTGHQFDVDSDLAGVVTNGSGQLDLSTKTNPEFGSTYVDLDPDFASGTLYGVMELTWDFDANSLDPAENEEIRLSLIQFDPRSTFVTAEFEIQREDDLSVTLFGNAVGTGSVDTGSATLNAAQTSNFIAVLAINLDSDDLSLHYSDDNGATFNTLGGGSLDPTRGVASLRAVFNNDFLNDRVLIDRVYLTDTNPFPGQIPSIPEPASFALFALGLIGLSAGRRRQ